MNALFVYLFVCLFVCLFVYLFVWTDGPELMGRMIQPPGFDSSKQYPVLVYVYGGPASQVVSELHVSPMQTCFHG